MSSCNGSGKKCRVILTGFGHSARHAPTLSIALGDRGGRRCELGVMVGKCPVPVSFFASADSGTGAGGAEFGTQDLRLAGELAYLAGPCQQPMIALIRSDQSPRPLLQSMVARAYSSASLLIAMKTTETLPDCVRVTV